MYVRRSTPKAIPDLAILGGVTRTGKDTTEQAFAAACLTLPGETVTISTDAVREELWSNPDLQRRSRTDPQSAERALFQMKLDGEAYPDDAAWYAHVLYRREADGSSYFHNRHDRQNRAIWKLADIPGRVHDLLQRPYLGRLLVQGVVMMPEHAAQLREVYPKLRALYLVNSDPAHIDRLLDIVESDRRNNPESNWLSGWSNDRIRRYLEMNVLLGQRRQAEAKAYGFPCHDMGHGNFQEKIRRNVDYLAYGDPL